MTYPKITIFFDNQSKSYKLEVIKFNVPINSYDYGDYKMIIIGNPIVDDKISINRTSNFLVKLIQNNFINYEILKEINGEFLYIIENKITNEIKIINDRFSSIPLCYCIIENKLFASTSQIDVLIKIKSKKNLKFENDQLFEFLKFKRLHGEKTYNDDILFLKSGVILSYKNNLKINRYYNIKIENNQNSLIENSKKLSFLLKKSIKSKINSDLIDYGIFFSGGMDSRIIAAILAKIDNFNSIKYYTLGWSQEGEYEVTKKVCEAINSENIFMKILDNYYDKYSLEKLFISGGMHNMYANIFLNLNNHLQKQTKILFHGHGLDYMFQGIYTYSKNINFFGKPTMIKRLLNLDYSNIIDNYINTVSYRVKNVNFHNLINNKYHKELNYNLKKKLNEIVDESRQFTDDPHKSWNYLITHNLSRHYSNTDILGIGTNAEQRKIANDNELFDFYLSIPKNQNLNGKIMKQSLILENLKLANIESANTRYRITASNLEITFNNYINKILYTFFRDNKYKFPSGRRKTWPNEYQILKESAYFRNRINNLYNSDALRENLKFLNFRELKSESELFLNTNKHNGFAQFIFLLITLENMIEAV